MANVKEGDRFAVVLPRNIDTRCVCGHKFASIMFGHKCPECGTTGNLLKHINPEL